MRTIERLGFIAGQFFKNSLIKKWISKKLDQFDVKVYGIENILRLNHQPYILASNHLRHKDKGLLKTGISADTFIIRRIVVSQSGKNPAIVSNYLIGTPVVNRLIEPFTRGVVKGFDSIPVGKGKSDFHSVFLKEVEKVINQNRPVLIYPAGRQDFDFEENHEIKAGAGYISLKFNLPIVPVYIKGLHYWNKKNQEVKLFFGKSFKTSGMTIDEISEKIKKEILQLKMLS